MAAGGDEGSGLSWVKFILNTEHEIEHYFNLAAHLGHNPHRAQCIYAFLRMWQGGKLCERHDHFFKRTFDDKCVDCAHEEIHINWALNRAVLRKEIFRSKNMADEWVFSIEKLPELKRPYQKSYKTRTPQYTWTPEMENILWDLWYSDTMNALKISHYLRDNYGLPKHISKNAVLGKLNRMKKKRGIS